MEAGTAAPAPRAPRTFPGWLRLLTVPVVIAVTLVGLWLFAAQISNDFAVSMILTGVWFALALVAALVVAWRWRPLALPVVGTFVITAGVVMGLLAFSTFRDVTVDEQIAIGMAASQLDTEVAESMPGGANLELARGDFVGQAHGASGSAAIVELEDGSRVLTFEELDTDNGPDLRVYLVNGSVDQGSVNGDFVDFGGLKGNKGNQRYEIPADVDVAEFTTVSIWCRAFSVSFAVADLMAS